MTCVLLPVIVLGRGDDARRGAERVAAQRTRAEHARNEARLAAGAPDVSFERDAEGAPMQSGEWRWSASHTRDGSAAVIARHAVGIDIERLDRAQAGDPSIVRRVLDAHEIDILGGDDVARFLRAWTAKEAVLKMRGVGLAELHGCRIAAVEGDERTVIEHRGRRTLVRHARRGAHVVALAMEVTGAFEVDWAWTCESAVCARRVRSA